MQNENENNAYAVEPLTDADLTGLGGWLTLVGIFLVAGAAADIRSLNQLNDIFKPNVWTQIINPASDFYSPQFVTFALVSLVCVVSVFFLKLYLIYLYFNKKRVFPYVFSITLILSMCLNITLQFAERWAVSSLGGKNGELDAAPLIFITINTLIWVSYMRKSRRVKLTFTNN